MKKISFLFCTLFAFTAYAYDSANNTYANGLVRAETLNAAVATVVIPVSLWFVVSSPSVVLTCLSAIVPLVDVGAIATVPDFVGMVSCRFDRPSSTYFCDVVTLRGSGSVAYAVNPN